MDSGTFADCPKGVALMPSLSIETPSYVPTRFIFGEGSSDSLPETVQTLNGASEGPRALLICGRRSVAKPCVDRLLDKASALCEITLNKQEAYPTIDGVTAMLHEARRSAVNLVIGIGGGSVIDAAKAIALLLNQPFDLDAALTGAKLAAQGVPLLVVPTTAGTGSEATSFATIWDMKRRKKYSLTRPQNYPALAIIDPLLQAGPAWADRVSCGFDALCQAIEGCWSRNSTDESIGFGLQAVALLVEGLDKLRANPNDQSAYPLLSKGSLYAGMTIAQGRTTIAHAISYPLTAWYGISHGHACALTIGALLRFNSAVTEKDCLDPRGESHVRAVIGHICEGLQVPDPNHGDIRIAALLRSCGQKSFAEIDEIDVDFLVQDVMSYDRFENNPRAMERCQLASMLQGLKRPHEGIGAEVTTARRQ
jgi:alcohol dehydrogenase class IV